MLRNSIGKDHVTRGQSGRVSLSKRLEEDRAGRSQQIHSLSFIIQEAKTQSRYQPHLFLLPIVQKKKKRNKSDRQKNKR